MNPLDLILGIVVAVGLTVYLIYAILNAERL